MCLEQKIRCRKEFAGLRIDIFRIMLKEALPFYHFSIFMHSAVSILNSLHSIEVAALVDVMPLQAAGRLPQLCRSWQRALLTARPMLDLTRTVVKDTWEFTHYGITWGYISDPDSVDWMDLHPIGREKPRYFSAATRGEIERSRRAFALTATFRSHANFSC